MRLGMSPATFGFQLHISPMLAHMAADLKTHKSSVCPCALSRRARRGGLDAGEPAGLRWPNAERAQARGVAMPLPFSFSVVVLGTWYICALSRKKCRVSSLSCFV